MKKIIAVLLLIVAVFSLSACNIEQEKDEVASKEREYTQNLQEEMQRQIGQPLVENYFEKKNYKMIYELRDDPDLITYLYTRNLEGKYIYEGKALGFGLPASIQYNRPNTVVESEEFLGESLIDTPTEVVDQAEPNGMYMSDGLDATWIIRIDEKTGELYPDYYEPKIVVSPKKKPVRLCAEWSLPKNY